MSIYTFTPENFPYVLNTYVRQELHFLIKEAQNKVMLIQEDTFPGQDSYLYEPLDDLAKNVSNLGLLLSYFRDVPLGKNANDVIVTGEMVRLKLEEWLSVLLEDCKKTAPCSGWHEVTDEELKSVKEEICNAVTNAANSLMEIDREMMPDNVKQSQRLNQNQDVLIRG